MTPDEIRSQTLDGRADIQSLAAAFGCTTRTIYATTERLKIPFVKVAGKRFFKVTALRAALEAEHPAEVPPARTPGRPRKTAAA
jgi:hypothetical protein